MTTSRDNAGQKDRASVRASVMRREVDSLYFLDVVAIQEFTGVWQSSRA
jgi:hypothetical protein